MKYRVPFLFLLLVAGTSLVAAQDASILGLSNRNGNHHGGIGSYSNVVLSGTVRTVGDQPVRDARVEVRTLGTGEVIASGYTLPNGSFELNNVPHGAYILVATLGVQEARERIELVQLYTRVDLRIATGTDQANGNAMISVSQLKIPDKAKKFFDQAQEAFQKNKVEQARDRVQQALQVFPNFAQALTLRGLLAMQLNHVDQARADLEQSIKADAGYGLAYIALGAIFNMTSQYDDAARVLERGAALSPSSWQAYFELSKTLLGKGQFEAALRQANKALELAPPKYGAVHLVRAHALLGLKDYNQAVAELEQYLGTEPNSPDSANARQTLSQVRAFLAASSGK